MLTQHTDSNAPLSSHYRAESNIPTLHKKHCSENAEVG